MTFSKPHHLMNPSAKPKSFPMHLFLHRCHPAGYKNNTNINVALLLIFAGLWDSANLTLTLSSQANLSSKIRVSGLSSIPWRSNVVCELSV
ncbi:hypothetical protein CEXT_73921 [Caerostris extrusa]|uniref:Uncharacterized protein n=1 Tax=Caerostris extrusa TaxID=172846 RepID=A0AAV4PC81_CAEEX|nr:hypothetical protein CEXT_73921 [Caerostris extrusa]